MTVSKQEQHRKRVTKRAIKRSKNRMINMWFDKLITKGKEPTFTRKEDKMPEVVKEALVTKWKADQKTATTHKLARQVKDERNHHRLGDKEIAHRKRSAEIAKQRKEAKEKKDA